MSGTCTFPWALSYKPSQTSALLPARVNICHATTSPNYLQGLFDVSFMVFILYVLSVAFFLPVLGPNITSKPPSAPFFGALRATSLDGRWGNLATIPPRVRGTVVRKWGRTRGGAQPHPTGLNTPLAISMWPSPPGAGAAIMLTLKGHRLMQRPGGRRGLHDCTGGWWC